METHEFDATGKGQSLFETRGINIDRDNSALIRLGKQPVLKRSFGFMSILGFSCTVLVTWEATLILFASGYTNGGPAGMVYGFLLVWAGTLSTFAALSELVSMAPTSGGQYHWVSMLASPSSSKFLSYITGWLTVGGWQAGVASASYLTGTMIQGVIALTVTDYSPQGWHGTLLFWAVLFFAVFINTVVSGLLPKFEGLILILHILGFFGIMIPLVVLGKHSEPSYVFTSFNNDGGWPTQGLSFFVGLLGPAYGFLGADAAFHMSEEIHNPSVVVPRSVMLTIVLNGVTGFAMILTFLFCIGDIDVVLATNTGYPFMEIFLQATHSRAGSAAMASLIIVLSLSATVGLLASTSRMFWSFARDRGLPGWRKLQQIDKRTSVPIWSVAVTMTISFLLALITIGSATAFNVFVSLTVVGLFTSYLLAASLLLYRRCTGAIRLSSDSPMDMVNTVNAPLVWGPWRLRGVFGIANNAFACIYLTIVLFFSFWPSATPVVAATMNYSSLMGGAVVLFAIAYYILHARKVYIGPVLETRYPITG
ncbi:hypothetical protein HYALB_00013595 [Hymenoscyphus albidus]|uniref:Amino acid transporter n=1 Tax=Hymenoscyphus albidus TaxID=595503 RepID=A0A9N9Q9W6_9HELO|nr:hypothetical protein HYALB_00013595 [Hymenoscyphus albidus]